MIALVLGCMFFVGGCAEVTQIAGEISASQAYEDTYQKEYQKAKARGLSDAEAQAVAKQAAEGKAAQQRSLFTGVGDVVSSAGEIDYESERAIGESLALEGFARYGMPVADAALQKYVNLVGHAVARNSARPGIPYRFVVVDSPLYNAFAAPGGILFVSATLVKSVNSEA
jgi:predicted Zn-dependent protease